MGFAQRLTQAGFIIILEYLGIFLLRGLGVDFAWLAFTPAGFLVIANLALGYTYYFRL